MRKYEEIKTVEFKSKNGVELTVVEGKWKEENMFSGTHFYRAFETKKGFEDGYVGSVDDSIGEMRSSTLGEATSFEEFVEYWKNRHVVDGFHESVNHDDGYVIGLYQGNEVSKDEFEKILSDVKMLLDDGCIVHYNDEHGVGWFEKPTKRSKKYKATHHRWGAESTEKMTIDDIRSFLREFFDLGYHYDKVDEW